MNAPHEPEDRDLDDLASALVDGLLDPDEAARVAADPDVAARAETIRHLRSVMREVPPHPATARDIAVAAALDAHDDPAIHPDPQVVETANHSRAWVRALPRRNVRPWLAAAASLLVIALAAVLLSRMGNSDDDLAATAEDAREAEATQPTAGDTAVGNDGAASGDEDADGDAAGSAAPEAAETPAFSGLDLLDLGEIGDPADLTSRVIASWSAGEGTLTEQPHDAVERESCPALSLSGVPRRGTSVYVAEARLAGEQVMVHLYRSNRDTGDDGRLRLVATKPSLR